jgi:hypothetical protein
MRGLAVVPNVIRSLLQAMQRDAEAKAAFDSQIGEFERLVTARFADLQRVSESAPLTSLAQPSERAADKVGS